MLLLFEPMSRNAIWDSNLTMFHYTTRITLWTFPASLHGPAFTANVDIYGVKNFFTLKVPWYLLQLSDAPACRAPQRVGLY